MKVALKDHRGKYVSMWDLFYGQHPLIANRDAIGVGETFELVIVEPDAPPHLPPAPPVPSGWERCAPVADVGLVACIHAAVTPVHTPEGAFEVTKRVAWLLRDQGFGLLRKTNGSNVVDWQGDHFAAGRIARRDGHLFKLLTDIPTTNGPSWQDEGVQPEQAPNFVAPINPQT